MTRTSPITLRWEFKWFFRRGPPACKNAVYTWLQCTRIFIQTSCRTSNQPTGRRWGSNLPLQTLISAGESSSAPWRYCSPLWLFCCNLLSNSVMWWVVLFFFFFLIFIFALSFQVQLTDFENAAYVVFVVLLTRVILSYKLDFIIPLSKVITTPQFFF